MMSQIPAAYKAMDAAIVRGELIVREGRDDKEFHFQRWVTARLAEGGVLHDEPGRNSYPDLTLVHSPEGIEVKGLATPGRVADFDGNSQVARPTHNGRAIYYAFGRYPKDPDGDQYPVVDLVVVPGSFLNADDGYTHRNRSIRTFGSYGDILLRDRKMYVMPTPVALLDGVEGTRTLVLPNNENPSAGFVQVGEFTRMEVEQQMVGYSFDLESNELVATYRPNPNAGQAHHFKAWRVVRPEGTGSEVRLRSATEQGVDKHE
jgi:hypothetical protein